LITELYFAGQQRKIFSTNVTLYAHFYDIDGLMPSNNARFNGYGLGRVKEIASMNDSSIEAVFSVAEDWLRYISVDTLVSLGIIGLLGNKLLETKLGGFFERPAGDGDAHIE
jgi:ABC-type transporter Mla subunit MlaD